VQHLDLLLNPGNLPVDKLVDLRAGRLGVGQEPLQNLDLRQRHAQRAAVPHEIELRQVGFTVVPIPGNGTVWRTQKPFPFIVANRSRITSRKFGQFSNQHDSSRKK